MVKRVPILTEGAIRDFVGMLPDDPRLKDAVRKSIRDFYRKDHPDMPQAVKPERADRKPAAKKPAGTKR